MSPFHANAHSGGPEGHYLIAQGFIVYVTGVMTYPGRCPLTTNPPAEARELESRAQHDCCVYPTSKPGVACPPWWARRPRPASGVQECAAALRFMTSALYMHQ